MHFYCIDRDARMRVHIVQQRHQCIAVKMLDRVDWKSYAILLLQSLFVRSNSGYFCIFVCIKLFDLLQWIVDTNGVTKCGKLHSIRFTYWTLRQAVVSNDSLHAACDMSTMNTIWWSCVLFICSIRHTSIETVWTLETTDIYSDSYEIVRNMMAIPWRIKLLGSRIWTKNKYNMLDVAFFTLTAPIRGFDLWFRLLSCIYFICRWLLRQRIYMTNWPICEREKIGYWIFILLSRIWQGLQS